jgi:hypothetical protein
MVLLRARPKNGIGRPGEALSQARPPWDLPRAGRAFFLIVCAAILVLAGARSPRSYGDGLEYYLMSESLFNHHTPDLEPEDLASLTGLSKRFGSGVGGAGFQSAYFQKDATHWYCRHFWAYPLLILPAKTLLHSLGLNELKAPQLTNAVLFTASLLRVLTLASLTPRQRLLLGFLLLFSPAMLFVLWPHPEVFSFAFVMFALTFMHEGRWTLGTLCASIASTQNPPLVVLVAFLWFLGILNAERTVRWRRALDLTLAALPALVSPLFYQALFGVPSLAPLSIHNVSLSRVLELLFDFNIGLLPYIPVTLALVTGLVGWEVVRARPWRGTQLAAVLLVMMLGCAAIVTWNTASAGPSRYTIWMLPVVFYIAVASEGASDLLSRSGGVYRKALVLAIGVQAAIVLSQGGLFAPDRSREHSYLARAVLNHFPAWYNPSYELFLARTPHQDSTAPHPCIYADGGRCRKALVKRRRGHAAQLIESCGFLPEAYRTWFDEAHPGDRDEWGYISY